MSAKASPTPTTTRDIPYDQQLLVAESISALADELDAAETASATALRVHDAEFGAFLTRRLEKCLKSTCLYRRPDSAVPQQQDVDMAELLEPVPLFSALPASLKPELESPHTQRVNGIPVSMAFARADGVIETMEGKRVGVNRELVSAFSKRLRISFFGVCLEAREHRVVFTQHSFKTVVGLLVSITRFAEFGTIPLPWLRLDDGLDVFELAVFMECPRIARAIARRLCAMATPESYVYTMHRLEADAPLYYQHLFGRLRADFHRVIVSESAMSLRPEELIRAVEGRVNDWSWAVNEFVIKYLRKHRLDCESDLFRRLVPKCTFVECQTHQRFKCWETEPPAPITPAAEAVDSVVSDRNRPVSQPWPYSVVMVFGGWATSGPTAQVETLDTHRPRWIEPKDGFMNMISPRSYHEIVAMPARKKLVVIGGFDGQSYFEGSTCYDLEKMELNTESYSCMFERRCYVSACAIDDRYVMAIGGYNNRYRLSSTEILDMETNVWQLGPRLNLIRSDAHSVAIGSQVYCIGGFDGHSCHQTVECYDAVQNSWRTASRKMRDKRSGVSSATLYGAVFAVGGFTGRARLSSGEFMDPREGVWHTIAHMNVPRSNFGVCTVRDEIFVAGGYDGKGTTTKCERFDMRANRWYLLPAMHIRRSALSMCRLDGDFVTDKLLQGDIQEAIMN